MMIEASTIVRINKMMRNLTGLPVRFVPADQVDSRQWPMFALDRDFESTPESLLLSGQSGRQTGLVVESGGELLGLIEFTAGREEVSELALSVSELVTDLLTFSLNATSDAQKLNALEERLELQQKPSNVIDFRQSRKAAASSNNEEEDEIGKIWSEMLQERPEKVDVFSGKSVLVRTTSKETAMRVAFEIHDRSGQWAFIQLKDLEAGIINRPEELAQLGNVTLFIEDLAQLTQNEQIKLAELVGRAQISEKKDLPRVIAGVSEDPVMLVHASLLLPHLVKLFAVTYFSAGNFADDLTAAETTSLSAQTISESLDHLGQELEAARTEKNLVPFHMQYLSDKQTVH